MSTPTCRGSRLRRRPAVPLLPLLAALAFGAMSVAARELPAQDQPSEAAVPGQLNSLDVAPRGGPPGTDVTVRGSGLPVNTNMAVGFGLLRSGYEILADVDTDSSGQFTLTVSVPSSVERDRRYYFLVTDTHQQPLTVSDAFHVSRPDGSLTVEGRVANAGGRCTELRSPDEQSYILLGDHVEDLDAGQEVVVEGRIAQASDCPEGLVIDVRDISLES